MEDVPLAQIHSVVPEWSPANEPAIALRGGYSHQVYALGQRHVLRMAPPERAHRLRHEALILADLAGRVDLHAFRHVLPRVVGEFDVSEPDRRPEFGSRGEWRGLVVNRFPGANAFRSWLDASPPVRRDWVRQAVTILRAVHGVCVPIEGRSAPPSRGDGFVVGWYATRIEYAGFD